MQDDQELEQFSPNVDDLMQESSEGTKNQDKDQAKDSLPTYDGSEDEQELYKLNDKQKWQISGVIATIFLVSTLLFFPYGKVLRYLFVSSVQGLPLSYGKLELSILGSSFIENITYQSPIGVSLVANQLRLDIPLIQFVSDNPNGFMQVSRVYLHSDFLTVSAEKLNIDMDIENLSLPFSKWRGAITLDAKRSRIEELNVKALQSAGINFSAMDVQKFNLKLVFDQSGIKFDDSQLISDLFAIKLRGITYVSENVTDSRLDGELCLKPAVDLEEKSSNLMGVYLLAGGTPGGELCLKIKGKLSKPDFQKPALPQAAPEVYKDLSTPDDTLQQTENKVPAASQPSSSRQRNSSPELEQERPSSP